MGGWGRRGRARPGGGQRKTDAGPTRVRRRLLASLVAAATGMLATLVGLGWDAALHAHDPHLAEREGPLSLANPSHALFAGGLAVASAGIVAALLAALDLGRRRPTRRLERAGAAVGTLAVLVAVGGLGAWAQVAADRHRAAHALVARLAAPAGEGAHGGPHAPAGTAVIPVAHDPRHGLAAPDPAVAPGHGPDHAAPPAGPAALARGHAHPTPSASWGGAPAPVDHGDHLEGASPDDRGDPTRATEEQRAAADWFRRATIAGTDRFRDVEVAKAAGYRFDNATGTTVIHVANPRYTTDGQILRPARPEFLLYARRPRTGELILIGAMYTMERRGVPGPAFGGPITVWHSHLGCYDAWGRRVSAPSGGACPAGTELGPGPEMIHVWLTADVETAYNGSSAPWPALFEFYASRQQEA
jgi:hypothetical protein